VLSEQHDAMPEFWQLEIELDEGTFNKLKNHWQSG
jgi:hypothetical protein